MEKAVKYFNNRRRTVQKSATNVVGPDVPNEGRAGVLLIYASWCGHCHAILPRLEEIDRQWNHQFPVFIAEGEKALPNVSVPGYPSLRLLVPRPSGKGWTIDTATSLNHTRDEDIDRFRDNLESVLRASSDNRSRNKNNSKTRNNSHPPAHNRLNSLNSKSNNNKKNNDTLFSAQSGGSPSRSPRSLRQYILQKTQLPWETIVRTVNLWRADRPAASASQKKDAGIQSRRHIIPMKKPPSKKSRQDTGTQVLRRIIPVRMSAKK